MRIAVVAAAVCLCIVGLSQADDAKAAMRLDTYIPPESLGVALKSFAQERNLQILYFSDAVRDVHTGGAVGQLTTEEALTQLLSGTGLTFRYVSEKAITILPASAGSGSSGAGSAPASPSTSPPTTSAGQSDGKTNFSGAFFLAQAASSENASPTTVDAQQKRAESTEGPLQQVIVTAQKRAEREKDVPISISVLSGDSLEASPVQGVSEALRAVPGVASFEGFEGGGTQVVIRGVAAPNFLFSGPSPIAYYLDSVPFGLVRGAIAPDSNAFDLDRVEVLRGPQGTLYGASALAGVIRVLTKDAELDGFDFKARGALSTTEDGGENYRGDMMVNVPIIDGKLAARAVVDTQRLSGWVDSPTTLHVNSGDLSNVRLKLDAQPTDRLFIGLSAAKSVSDFGAPSTSRDDGKISALGAQPYSLDYSAYGAKISYESSPFTVTSNTSYLRYLDNGYLDLYPFVSADASGPPLPFYFYYTARTFAEELLVNGRSDSPWKWSAGAFYRDSTDHTMAIIPSAPPPQWAWRDFTRSYAVFGEIGHRFFEDRLEWTLGLRNFHDTVKTQGDSSIPNQSHDVFSNPFSATSPRAVLTWHPGADLMAYASYSQGFRSGWPQSPPIYTNFPAFTPVKPDKLDNYEIGTKDDFFEHRLALEAAVYYMNWRDIQQSLSVPVNGLCCDTVGVNDSSASGVGADLSLISRPVDGLQLAANFSWNNLQFDSDVLSEQTVLFARGQRPNFSPEYTAGGSAEYLVSLGTTGYTANVAASVNYLSSLPNRALTTSGPLAVINNPGDPMTMVRVSVTINAPAHWSVMIYGDNLSNYRGSVDRSYQAYNYPDWDVRYRPRTLGVQLDYRLK